MQVLQCVDDLSRVALNLKLVQAFPSLQQFVHTLVLAELQKDVNILAVFEEVLKVAHIDMLDAPVDFDLTHQLLFSTTLCQTRLLDNLGCMNKLGFRIDELEAFGESTFSEELAL